MGAYQDTLMKGIPEFFPFYDVDYKASLDGGTTVSYTHLPSIVI